MPAKRKYKKFDISSIQKDLKIFLNNNPSAKLKEEEGAAGIYSPWGDDSLFFSLEDNPEKTIDTLNRLILPPPFSAIYHIDSKSLEFIYSPYGDPEEFSRRFAFSHQGQDYNCDFSAPSNDLMHLVDAFEPKGPASTTDYRNLLSFKRYRRIELEAATKTKREGSNALPFVPVSFWLRGVSLDSESSVLSLARTLNFYMYYFDRETPRILIHDIEKDGKCPIVQFPFGEFPTNISSRQVDPYVLGLWESALSANDTFRRFLYFYQIIEYASFYYLNGKLVGQMQQILSAPESAAFPQAATQRILESLASDRMTDEAKIEAVISEAVNPENLWRDIEANIDCFCSDVEFDGGFVLKALLPAKSSKKEFLAGWERSLPNSFRKIRNALVHAREARMASVIAPTRKNYNLLRPWIAPLSSAAMQVALYTLRDKS